MSGDVRGRGGTRAVQFCLELNPRLKNFHSQLSVRVMVHACAGPIHTHIAFSFGDFYALNSSATGVGDDIHRVLAAWLLYDP